MDRATVELTDEVEEEVKSVKLEKGKWRVGGMFRDPYWRAFLQIDSLPYDVLLPGLFKTQEESEKQARRIAGFMYKSTLGVKPN